MTKYMPTCTLWFMAIFSILALLLVGFFCLRILWQSNDKNRWEKFLVDKSPEMQAKYNKITGSRFLIFLIMCFAFVFGIALLILFCLKRDTFTFAEAILKLGVDSVFRHPLLFGVLALCFLFLIGNIALIFYSMLGIYTTGSRDDNPLDGRPYPKYSLNIWKFLLMAFFLFGGYWLVSLWNNILDFTVAGTAINDYFRIKDKTVIHPFCAGLTYHLGSIAYASLVLTPIDIIRFLFGWIYDAIRVERPSGFQKCLAATCVFCCWPYERWCLMIDDNALAMVYMIKRNFCPSGRKDYYLNLRVGRSVEELRSIGLVHSMTGRFTASLFAALVVYWAFTTIPYFSSLVFNPLVPTIVIYSSSN